MSWCHYRSSSTLSCSTAQRFPWRGIVAFFICFFRRLIDPRVDVYVRVKVLVSSMTAEVKALTPTSHQGRELLRSTNIPFLDRNVPDAYTTSHQADFQHFYSERAKRPQPRPAQFPIKDLRYLKEYLTEATESYKQHELPQIIHIPYWTKSITNFKLETDLRDKDAFTTEYQKLEPHPAQPPQICLRPKDKKLFQQVEKLPESTTQATFIPHHSSALSKAKAKHLEKGLPIITGNGRYVNYVSHYKDTFLRRHGNAAQPVKKLSSSVRFGDPTKIVERETTHSVTFSRPADCRLPKVKGLSNLRFGFSEDSWSSTSREAFCDHKQRDPVVYIKRNPNVSSLPKGDADEQRNRERMSVTTNKIFFSYLKGIHQQVSLPEPGLKNKSHIELSSPDLSGFSYRTSAQEHYGKKKGGPGKPAVQPSSNILRGPDFGPNITTTKALKTSKQTVYQSHQKSSIWFPVTEDRFSTTTRDDYTAKPLTLRRPGSTQTRSHFTLK